MSYKDSERYRKVYSYYRPVPRPTDPGGVSKDYVDEALRAMDWKQSVKYATTGTIDITTNGSAAIDGADTLSDEDRILVKNQPSAAENGIYMYYASTSTLARTLDATTDALTCGATVYVESGSTNEKSIFTLVTQDPITVGTTAQTWMSIIAGGGVPGSPLNSVQFNDGGSFGGDANFTFDKTTDTLTVTNISGSLTRLSDGSSYLIAGPNITINTNSLGQVEVTGSAGGGGSPGGANPNFQYNDGAGGFAGAGDFNYRGTGYVELTGSFVQGTLGTASGLYSHAEGLESIASGTYSHAEGYLTYASGTYSHSEGESTLAVTSGSHAEGRGTVAGITALAPYDGGYLGQASTSVLKLANDYGDVTGYFPATTPVIFTNLSTYFLGDTVSNSSFDGTYTYITASTNTTLDGPTYVTVSPGFSVPAAYEQPVVSLIFTHAHAEGYDTHAVGAYSHAEGYGSKAVGAAAHAEGGTTTAHGNYSHAEGYYTTATGGASHAEGESTTAAGFASHAEGEVTTAHGNYSHAEGLGTIASGSHQHAAGKYNLRDNTASLFVIGDGTGDADVDRHDVLRVNVGRVEVTGTLAVTGSFEVTGSSYLVGDVFELSGSLLVSGTSHFDGDVFITGSSIFAGDVLELSASLLVSGATRLEGDLMVTGSVFSTLGFSGSLTTLVDGSPYLLAGPNITINTNSLGQVEVTGSAGGGGDVYWTSTTSNAIFTTGSVAISGGEVGIDAAEDKGTDVFFYVSGSINGSGVDDKKAVFGGDVRISGSLSHGAFNPQASGDNSHAEGFLTYATGPTSHAEGYGTTASGGSSHAEGQYTQAIGAYSHAEGLSTIASGNYQHVAGQYNLRDNATSLFVVGDGSGDDNSLRHDILRVNSGSVEVTGSLLVVGPSFISGAMYVSGAVDIVGDALELSGTLLVSGSSHFAGDVFVTGSLKVGTGSVLITSEGIQVGSSSLQILRSGTSMFFYDEATDRGVSLSTLAGSPRRLPDVSTSRMRDIVLPNSVSGIQWIVDSNASNPYGGGLTLKNSLVGEVTHLDLFMSGAEGDVKGLTMLASLPTSGTIIAWSPRGSNKVDTLSSATLLSGCYGLATEGTSLFMCSTGSSMMRLDAKAINEGILASTFASGSYYGGDLSGRIAVLGDYVYGASPASGEVVYMATSASWIDSSNSFLLDVGHTFAGGNPYSLFPDPARRRLWVGLTGSNSVAILTQSAGGTLTEVTSLSVPSVTYMGSDDRYVWMLSSGSTSTTRVDPETLQATSMTLNGSPGTFGSFTGRSTATYDGQHMWFGCGDTIYRVDPRGMLVVNSSSIDATKLPPGAESAEWTALGCNPRTGDVYGFVEIRMPGGAFGQSFGLDLDAKDSPRGATRYKSVTNEDTMTLADETVFVTSGSSIILPKMAPIGTSFTIRSDGTVFNSGSLGVGSARIRAERFGANSSPPLTDMYLTEPNQTMTFVRLGGGYHRMGAGGYSMSFDNSHLVADQLHVSHSLGNRYNLVQVYNGSDFLTSSTSVEAVSENVTTLDFSGQTPLIGVWHVVVR